MDNGASSYRRFLDGDDKGIAEIVEDYKDGLILYLNSYVDNIFIAEKLTEDTFFRLITKKPKYAGKSTFKTWLYAIGRNIAIDFIRHNSKVLNTSIEDMEEYLMEEQSLEQSYIEEERKRKILVRVVTVMGCLCLVALLSFGMWKNSTKEDQNVLIVILLNGDAVILKKEN